MIPKGLCALETPAFPPPLYGQLTDVTFTTLCCRQIGILLCVELEVGTMARTKWNDRLYVKVYELAKSGLSESAIASAIGTTKATLSKWKSERPALRDAIKQAKQDSTLKTPDIKEYIYKRLPSHLQDLWDEIDECEKEENGLLRAQALIEKQSKVTRQHFFLYALVDGNFNLSEACRKVCISRSTLERWIKDDPDFSELIDEIHWHKKNFFEGHLCKLIRQGDSSATIFANRTFNKDRGYGDSLNFKGKVEHDHKGKVEHDHIHQHVDLDSLEGFPIEAKIQLLDAMETNCVDSVLIEDNSNGKEVQKPL